MIAIRGGQVLTAAGFVDSDVMIDGGVISEIGDLSTAPAAVIDASGCLVGPGFVDLHAHFRDPGQTWKEDLETGSRAAAAGGFTAVLAMPNTEPAVDNVEVVRTLANRGSVIGLVQLAFAAALTRERRGLEPADVESLYSAGVRVFSDDGDSVGDEALLLHVMGRLARLPGTVVSQHAEDSTQTAGGQMHEGDVSARLGFGGLPTSAETGVVARDLRLAGRSGCRYHCQHVSSLETVDLIRAAKRSGQLVTAEVTPHHLWFTDNDVAAELDPNLKMYPPLRTEDDRQGLRRGLVEGTIDCVATDHAPHTPAEKTVAFDDAPRGVIGLETAASVAWMVLEDQVRFFEVMSHAPARIAGMEGQGAPLRVGNPANVVVFGTADTWVPERFHSKSSNSPFHQEKLAGRVRATVYGGKVTYQLGDEDE